MTELSEKMVTLFQTNFTDLEEALNITLTGILTLFLAIFKTTSQFDGPFVVSDIMSCPTLIHSKVQFDHPNEISWVKV